MGQLLILVLVAGLSTAQAADTTLTLACKGTVADEGVRPKPISRGIVVNFTARTVQGLEFPVKIAGIDETAISFGGSEPSGGSGSFWVVTGDIDRVTGDMSATSILVDAKTLRQLNSLTYALKCTPTQRMF